MESGERSECCPGGAFAEGENEVSESTERESKARPKGFERPLRLRGAIRVSVLWTVGGAETR